MEFKVTWQEASESEVKEVIEWERPGFRDCTVFTNHMKENASHAIFNRKSSGARSEGG